MSLQKYGLTFSPTPDWSHISLEIDLFRALRLKPQKVEHNAKNHEKAESFVNDWLMFETWLTTRLTHTVYSVTDKRKESTILISQTGRQPERVFGHRC